MKKWICLASYLIDVFDKVNELSLYLQIKSISIVQGKGPYYKILSI